MKRHVAGLAMLAALAVWVVLTVGPTAAFQAPRGGEARPPAAGAGPARDPAAAQPRPAGRAEAQAGPVRGEQRAARPTERTVPVSRGRILLIDQVTLASDVPGIVDEVAFREGDEVPAGAVVARLLDDVPAAALATAQKLADSEVERQYAIAAHRVAVAAHAAATEANQFFSGAVPRVEVERLELDGERARLQIEKAGNDLEVAALRANEAEAQLKAFTVRARFGGVVTRVHKQPGEAVRQGDPILEMVSTKRVRVEGYVEIDDFWEIRRGQLVQVQIDLTPERYAPEGGLDSPRAAATQPPPQFQRSARPPRHQVEDRVFEGQIVFVDRTVHPVTGQVRVWAEVENPDDLLKGGLHARMTISPDRTFEADPPETDAANDQ